jgi:hypothetical protein
MMAMKTAAIALRLENGGSRFLQHVDTYLYLRRHVAASKEFLEVWRCFFLTQAFFVPNTAIARKTCASLLLSSKDDARFSGHELGAEQP